MWSRVAHLSDQELTHFTIEEDLALVRLICSFYLDPTSIRYSGFRCIKLTFDQTLCGLTYMTGSKWANVLWLYCLWEDQNPCDQ